MDMKLIVNTRNKKQEKAIKDFLEENAIDYSIAREDAAIYKTTTKKIASKKETAILSNLEKSVSFVNKYKKGKARARSLQQLLDEL